MSKLKDRKLGIVYWRDHTSINISSLDPDELKNLDWKSAVPSLTSIGEILHEDEDVIVINPHPIVDTSVKESLLHTVLIVAKNPFEGFEEVRGKKDWEEPTIPATKPLVKSKPKRIRKHV